MTVSECYSNILLLMFHSTAGRNCTESVTGLGGGRRPAGGWGVGGGLASPVLFHWLTFLPALGCLGAQLGAGWSNWGSGNFPLM